MLGRTSFTYSVAPLPTTRYDTPIAVMTDISTSFQTILSELARIAANPRAYLTDPTTTIPGIIQTGGGTIFINSKAEHEIALVADWLLNQRSSLHSSYTQSEWRSLIRRYFGSALPQLDTGTSLEDNARKLRNLIEQQLSHDVTAQRHGTTSFGCSLFSTPLESEFKIGPVLIQPKAAWLKYALDTNQISKISYNRLRRACLGRSLRKRKSSNESVQENSILTVLRTSQMICTITTEGLAPEMARQRSIIAARLALVSIALMWPNASYMLNSFRLSVDHGPRVVDTLPATLGKKTIGGWSWIGDPFGQNVSTEDWEKHTRSVRHMFDLAGEMISCWTSTKCYINASALLRCISQALFFFREGCREENDLMAIIKFTAALESLLSGKKNKLYDLLFARLNIKRTDVFRKDKTLKQIVERIYNVGRSRTLHGTNPDILHDWRETRQIADDLARACIVSSMHFLHKYPNATDPADLRT